MPITIIFGADVWDALQAEKVAKVTASTRVPGCFESESLCRWQGEIHNRGFRGAEIVKSLYGCSVRSDTGLENFCLLASSRFGALDGTPEDAERWAWGWQQADPTRRYVFVRDAAVIRKVAA